MWVKRLLISVFAVPVITASAVACSSDSALSSDGGTLRIAVQNEPDCLDPHQSPTEASRALSRPILESLVRQNADGSVSGALATSWTTAPDLRSYTFKIRAGVKFSDGTTFDAQAVAANLDHIVDPKTKSMLASSLISAYSGTNIIDSHTVAIELKYPDSSFLSALATANLGIESPASLRAGTAALCKKVIGTGPYRSDQGLRSQVGISYQRNVADGEGYSAIDIQFVPDDSARVGALTSGQVDAIVGVDPNKIKQLSNTTNLQIRSESYPGAVFSYWPNTSRAPLNDIRVRTAIRIGLDWAQVAKNVSAGTYQPARNVLSATTPGYDKSVEPQYRFDPARANALLDEAGWSVRGADGIRTKNGVRLRLTHLWSDASISDLAVQIQGLAKALGIDLIEENLDGGTYVERLLSGNYDILDTGFASPGPQVLQVLFGKDNIPTPQRGIANNLSRYDSPATQELFKQALAAPNQQAQYNAYKKAQWRIAEDAAVFPIYESPSTVGALNNVAAIGFDLDGSFEFYKSHPA